MKLRDFGAKCELPFDGRFPFGGEFRGGDVPPSKSLRQMFRESQGGGSDGKGTPGFVSHSQNWVHIKIDARLQEGVIHLPRSFDVKRAFLVENKNELLRQH